MSYTIAITGKGGAGKTTLAGLLVGRLIARGCAPVLAVDADPNTCLDAVLGVKAGKTVGRVREEAREIVGQGLGAGVSKQELLEMKIAESLVEAEDFDLIAMGRCEGPGCYCYANNVLKDVIRQISASYPYIVIDNEAGLENLSRRLAPEVDLLVLVADPSQQGLETVRRLHELAGEMKIKYAKLALVVNRLRGGGLPESVKELRERIGADFVSGLPEDAALREAAERGESVLTLPAENPVVAGVEELLTEMAPCVEEARGAN